MTTTGSKRQRPAGKAGGGSLVWRIYHFKERFEMDGYVRQGGLDYMRMFVTATTKDKSNESSEFLHQLDELEHYYPEQRDAYEGRFWRIGRLTATQEDWLRGYLLDADQQPLSVGRVAARLHLSVGAMKQTLAALKRVGLLECLPCPAFERPVRQEDEQGKGKEHRTQGQGKGGRKPAKPASSKAAARAIRNHFETFQNVLENSKNIQESENRTRIEEQKKILGLSASDPTKANTKPTPGQAQTNSEAQANAQGPTAAEAAQTPATAPPIMPTFSDAGGSGKVIPFAGPPGSVHPEPSHISHSLAGIRRRCNTAATQAGREIYVALGKPWDDGTPEAARQVGNFRKAFEEAVDAGLSSPQLLELWESLIAEAERLRKVYANNGGYFSAARVWRGKIFPGKLAARLPPARASPAAATM